ncbi:glycosyltransferase [Planctomycetota bacterium]
MGWGFVEAISKYHDLWVITEKEKFESEIEAELEKRPELRKRIRFYYIPKTRHRTLRKFWPPSYYWFYRAWQKKAFTLGAKLHNEIGFDIIHQLNMVGFREPGYLWELDAPFVWGPIGGMGILPWRFLTKLGFYGFIYHLGKNIINLFQMRYSKRPRKAVSKAKALIAATPDTHDAMKRKWGVESEIICEVGPPGRILSEHSIRKENEPLRLVWSGLHVPRKALNLLLRVLSSLRGEIKWSVNILGKGPRTNAWKKQADELRISQRCNFHGWVPKDKAVSIVANSHLFIMTSLADLTSTVLLEALSQGLPVICLDHCGFSNVVTDNCGIKIPVKSPNQVTTDFAFAIESLWNDETYRQKLANGALERAKDFSWDKKIEQLNGIYQEAI